MDPQQSTTEQKPSKAYLQLSTEESVFPSQQPKKQLLILDLNGTLISRIKCRARSGRAFYARPHYQAFLDFIFKHFEVMVWSSARQQNVEKMCHIFTKPLKLVWSRNHLKLSQHQFDSNVDTIKDLDIVWEYFSNEYNATNTIVLDDSPSKLAHQPYNLIHIRTFNHEEIREGFTDNELLKVIRYLDNVRCHSNVANYVRNEPFLSHRHLIPENKELDLAMRYFTRAGKFAKPYQPTQKSVKRRRDDDDGNDVESVAHHQEKQVNINTKVEELDDNVSVKLGPVDQFDDSVSFKLESEDYTSVARQEDEVEEPPRKKLTRTKSKKEKPPRHMRKPRHKKQKKTAVQQTKAASTIPIRPQTEKKLKSIQESIKQRKQKKEKNVKIELQAVENEPQTVVAIKMEP
ncbi:NLI interacting factor family phosphatase [Mucor ambiguus]|uniref:Mitochondrial import inner membrane translocase subunit TIM50 n=1 Tax=Mucor ambiguus TaxID=91626 RepID=A0A0C9MC25_9FUNG|nr:NLI interacting factor family phosphatase [Mucor ambiguus]